MPLQSYLSQMRQKHLRSMLVPWSNQWIHESIEIMHRSIHQCNQRDAISIPKNLHNLGRYMDGVHLFGQDSGHHGLWSSGHHGLWSRRGIGRSKLHYFLHHIFELEGPSFLEGNGDIVEKMADCCIHDFLLWVSPTSGSAWPHQSCPRRCWR